MGPGTQRRTASSLDAFEIRVEAEETGLVVAVCGEMDGIASPQLFATLAEAAADESIPVILDLSGVTFVDSRGLGVVVAVHDHLSSRPTGLTIRQPSAVVRRLMELCDLGRLLAPAFIPPGAHG